MIYLAKTNDLVDTKKMLSVDKMKKEHMHSWSA